MLKNLVRGNITITGHVVTRVAFRNRTPFFKCITKINGTTIDAEHFDLVMPMYNLMEYSSNYSDTRWSLWFHSKYEANNFDADIAHNNNFKSFYYKAKLSEDTVAQPAPNNNDGILKNAATDVSLKYLSNFWRLLEMPLINCKVEFKLKWTKYCVLAAASTDNAIADSDVGNLKTVPEDLKKLSDVADKQVVRNTKFNTLNTKVSNLEKKIPDATTSIHINQ